MVLCASMAEADTVAEEFKSALVELDCNSKPHINMLTMLAEENMKYSSVIVKTIVDHLLKVPTHLKLPNLYLIDSIIKLIGKEYLTLFSLHIVDVFSSVFEKVDEKTRVLLYKLRQTWNKLLPSNVLYGLDVKVQVLDPAWPITAKQPAEPVHTNPKLIVNTISQTQTTFNVNKDEKKDSFQGKNSKINTKPVVEKPKKLQMEKKNIETSVSKKQNIKAVPVSNKIKKPSFDVNKGEKNFSQVKNSKTEVLKHLPVKPKQLHIETKNIDTNLMKQQIINTVPVSIPFNKLKRQAIAIGNKEETQYLETKNTKSEIIKQLPDKQKQPQIVTKESIERNLNENQNIKSVPVSIPINKLKHRIDDSKTEIINKLPQSSIGNIDIPINVHRKTHGSVNKSLCTKIADKGSVKILKTKSPVQKSYIDTVAIGESNLNISLDSTEERVPAKLFPTKCDKNKSCDTVNKEFRVKEMSLKTLPLKKDTKSHILNAENQFVSSKRKYITEDKETEDLSKLHSTTSNAFYNKKQKTEQILKLCPVAPQYIAPKNEDHVEKKPKLIAGITKVSDFPKFDSSISRKLMDNFGTNLKESSKISSSKIKIEIDNFENDFKERSETLCSNSNIEYSLLQNSEYEQMPGDSKTGIKELVSTFSDLPQQKVYYSTNDEKGTFDEGKKCETNEIRIDETVLFGSKDQDLRRLPNIVNPIPKALNQNKEVHLDDQKNIQSNLLPSSFSAHTKDQTVDNYFSGNQGLSAENSETQTKDAGERDLYLANDVVSVIKKTEEGFRDGKLSRSQYLELRRDLDLLLTGPEYKNRMFNIKGNSQSIAPKNCVIPPSGSSMKSSELSAPISFPPGDSKNIEPKSLVISSSGPSMQFTDLSAPISFPSGLKPEIDSFVCNGEKKTIYFIQDQAYILTENNEPLQLLLNSEPKNVFIDRLPQPLLLSFDGKCIDFGINGKSHSVRFGVPTREIYIDNLPYSLIFGGPPISVRLSDGEVCQINVSGPAPLVFTRKVNFNPLEGMNSLCDKTQFSGKETDFNSKIHSTLIGVTNIDSKSHSTLSRVTNIDSERHSTLSKVTDIDNKRYATSGVTDVDNKGHSSLSGIKDIDMRIKPDKCHNPPFNNNVNILLDSDLRQKFSGRTLEVPVQENYNQPTLIKEQHHSETENYDRDSTLSEVTDKKLCEQTLNSVENSGIEVPVQEIYNQSTLINEPHHSDREDYDRQSGFSGVADKKFSGQLLHVAENSGMQVPHHSDREDYDRQSAFSGVADKKFSGQLLHVAENSGMQVPVPENYNQSTLNKEQHNDRAEYDRHSIGGIDTKFSGLPLHTEENSAMELPVQQNYNQFTLLEEQHHHEGADYQEIPSWNQFGNRPFQYDYQNQHRYRPNSTQRNPYWQRPPLVKRPFPSDYRHFHDIQQRNHHRFLRMSSRMPSKFTERHAHRHFIPRQNPSIQSSQYLNEPPSFPPPRFPPPGFPISRYPPPPFKNTIHAFQPPITSVEENSEYYEETRNNVASQASVTSVAENSMEYEEVRTNDFVLPKSAGVTTSTVDIHLLLKKLTAAGILTSKCDDKNVLKENMSEEMKKENEDPSLDRIPPITFTSKSLQKFYPGVISSLYSGSQCGSCEKRFQNIECEDYSRHLDWHFRMNQRKKDSHKMALSCPWFYELQEWLKFEEFENHDDAKSMNFFELQEQLKPELGEKPIPSVRAKDSVEEKCAVCGESFQLFWLEDEEEWHLRNSVCHENLLYHPDCYEDFKKEIKATEYLHIAQDTNSIVETSTEIDTHINELMDSMISEISILESLISQVSENVANFDIAEKDVYNEEEDCISSSTMLINSEESEMFEQEVNSEILEGKPGEEEDIGIITDLESESENNLPNTSSEMVVIQSGVFTFKVKPESLQQVHSPINVQSKEYNASDRASEFEDNNFRPPTPDPRFRVMPVVKRGTELSGLCTIS